MIPPNTPLKGLPIAVLDVESTGVDTATARIVDIAVVHVTLGGEDPPEVAYSSLVNPGVPIPSDASRIHGIDDEMVAGAPRLEDVGAMARAQCVGRVICAYNAPYDYGMLCAEGARLGWSQDWDWPWLDLMIVRRAVKKYGGAKLADVVREAGIELDAHGAAGDALATAMLATPMLRRWWSDVIRAVPTHRYVPDDGNEESAPTIGYYLDWQRSAALAQEADYAAYCRRSGHVKPPRCSWHELYNVPAPTWDLPASKVRITKDGRAA